METILKTLVILFILLALALLALPRLPNNKNLPRPQPDISIPLAFNGDSIALKATEIVPTLDTPIPDHKNAVWCASFLAGWKMMEQNLAKGPVALDRAPEMVKALNAADDPRPSIPPSMLYVAAGWNDEGIVDQIRNGMHQKFPDNSPPVFPGITPDSFVTYAYLETHVKFPIPYNQNDEALVFTNSSGKPTRINSFGVPLKDANTYFKLRAQPCVIFYGDMAWPAGSYGEVPNEFVIDLCPTSAPDQVLVARIARRPTLAAAVAYVETKITGWGYAQYARQFEHAPADSGLRDSEVLLVPDLHWFISHDFSELEGKTLVNPTLKRQPLSVAREDIAFYLDKSGAGVRAESREFATATPRNFIVNQPFLLYMKKRGAPMPYFAMWVDNAELLCPWTGTNGLD